MRFGLWIPLFLVSVNVAGAGPITAGPITLELIQQNYTTSVSMYLDQSGQPLESLVRTATGTVPIADQVESTYWGLAQASAGMFSVFAKGDAAGYPRGGYHSMTGMATSIVDFKTPGETYATLVLDMATGGSPAYIDALVELRNLTTNELLWRVGYTNHEEWLIFRNTYQGTYGSSAPPYPLPSLDLKLNNTDQYRMTLLARANGSGDSQKVRLQVRVPEPGTALLLTLAAGMLIGGANLRSNQ